MASYVIVSCSNRKRGAIPDELHLRTVPDGPDRAARWLERLRSIDAPMRPATELYGGAHWQIAMSLPEVASVAVRLLVASAGYGLIDVHSPLKAYAATLTPGHADSVAGTMSRTQFLARVLAWWAEVQAGSPGSVGSISDVVTEDPDPYVVLVASPPYVSAVEQELLTVADNLGPNRVTIISTGDLAGTKVAGLGPRITASIEHHVEVSGTRAALNVSAARIALSRLDGHPPTRHALEAILTRELATLGPPRTWNRRTHSDDAVRAWIRTEFGTTPGVSRTRLLERFRADGRACEQQRFGRLYREVIDRRPNQPDAGVM